jgi:type IV pilus assembly protein PilM
MIFGKRNKQIVGLDIGSSAIKLVELKKKGGEYVIEKLGFSPLSLEAIVDGAVMDATMVVDTIGGLINRLGAKNPNFGISVSGHAVIIKRITLPVMSMDELKESIQWEAESYIPFNINDVNLSYQYLGDEGDGQNMSVLLVASKKDKVTDYTSVVTQAGKTVVLVDVDAIALQNCYEICRGLNTAEVVALINIGASVMNFNILNSGQSLFWRDVSFGGNQYTEAIMKELNLSFEQAEALKKGENVGGHSMESVIPIFNAVTEELSTELRKTLDFYRSSTQQEKIDRIILSGGSSKVANLTSILQQKMGIPVEVLNPFASIKYDESVYDPAWVNDIGPSMVIAVGLAIREVGD